MPATRDARSTNSTDVTCHSFADGSRVSLEELERLGNAIACAAAQIDAATQRLLCQIREFDEQAGWRQEGALSMAHWLNWRIGLGIGAAREKVRVAHALATLPRIDEAFARGALSYSKVRAMTRVATAETEEALCSLAEHATAAQLEKICRLYRSAVPAHPEQEARRQRRRTLSFQPTDDGLVRMTVVLHPEEAAVLRKAIDVSAGIRDDAGRQEGPVDALVDLAERSLRGDQPSHPAVDVSVHLQATTFDGAVEGDTGISAETSRRLTCDSAVAVVLEDPSGNILNVGRRTRTISGALRRALESRDQGCRFPGCHNRHADGHHVQHWSQGGETSLENLVLLCRRHHRLVHEGGFRIVKVEGDPDWSFVRPDGRPVGSFGPIRYDVMFWNRESTTNDPMALAPTTYTPSPDYARIVDVLLSRAGLPGRQAASL